MMDWLKKNVDTMLILIGLAGLMFYLNARNNFVKTENEVESKNLGFYTASKVCVDADWTECLDLPNGELVKVYVVPDSDGDILVVKPQH